LKRKAFGMIQVIFFMVILSSILAVSMKYASITAKQTMDIYVREQAELFMQSSLELTLLGISSYDRTANGTCLNKLKIISQDQRFIADINITKYYLKTSQGCDREELIQNEQTNGMVSIDIVVETNNTHPKNSHPMRLTRRSLQRP
jgi:hypothetical protein